MTAIEISLSTDCKYLIIKTTGIEGNGELAFFNNGEQVFTTGINYNNSDVSCVPSVVTYSTPISTVYGETSPGIITVTAIDSPTLSVNEDACGIQMSGTSAASVLSSCELDCCLADKTLELTKCDCESSKCDGKLQEAQKLYLYIQAINTLLKQTGTDMSINSGIESQAIEILNKAKNLCLTSCGCNC